MLRSLISLTKSPNTDYIFPKVDPSIDGEDCFNDCSDCTVHCPAKLKIETSTQFYGHIKEFHTHVVVATGKTDWKPHVEDEKGSLMEAFKTAAGNSKLGVCDTIPCYASQSGR